jgi:hypothetical protein
MAFVDPDFFITIAFVSYVVLLALVAGLFARSERRRSKDADASATEIMVRTKGVLR